MPYRSTRGYLAFLLSGQRDDTFIAHPSALGAADAEVIYKLMEKGAVSHDPGPNNQVGMSTYGATTPVNSIVDKTANSN